MPKRRRDSGFSENSFQPAVVRRTSRGAIATRSGNQPSRLAYIGGKLGSLAVNSIPYVNTAVDIASGISSAMDLFSPTETETSTQNNNSTSMRSTTNAQAGRASAKKKGHVKLAGTKKNIKVSTSLRKKIKEVIKDACYTGTYISDRQQYVDFKFLTVSAASGTWMDTKLDWGPYTTNRTNSACPTGMPGRICQWWSCGQAGAPGVVPAGFDWNFFTPLKVLDAASVLWNKKRQDPDYYFQGGNFTIDAAASTGVPRTGSDSLPKKTNLKLIVDDSYAEFSVKNMSQRRMFLTFYHCVPKVRHPEKLPLTALHEGIIHDLGTDDNLYNAYLEGGRSSVGLKTAQQLAAEFMLNPSLEPKAIPSFSNMYKYEEIKINIAPGETYNHKVQGPKNYTLDFLKLTQAGIDKSGFLFKQSSVSVMLKMELDQAMALTTTGTYSPVSYPSQLGVGQFFQCPLGITVKEFYRLKCPETAGFIQQAISAGSTQMLNLKKRSFAMLNAGSTPVSANYQLLTRFDEENPAATITAASPYI